VTIFGPDISSYEAGLDLSRLTDAAFVLAKVTEGTYYTDADFPGWRTQAARISKPLFWYHFLSGEDATAQADHTAGALGATTLPGMLDCEPEGKFAPTLAQIIAYVKAAHAVGLNLRLVYLPHWYWVRMGSPNLSELAALGVSLVSSAYPGGSGTAAQLYPGDGAAGWLPYGGMTPLIYQFTNQASDGGQRIDFNAFRGTFAALLDALTPAPNPTPGPNTNPSEEDLMPAFATGQINAGTDAETVILPPPANFGSAGWGDVWFSLGCDFGDAHVRVAAWTHGSGWTIVNDVLVQQHGDRINPFGGKLPTAVQKISVKRLAGTENLPMSYLIEATHR
jgi:glycosyl hydrolase family 25